MKKCYLLVEFPYPSGDGLHVGHPRPYIAMDIIARKRRRQGYDVLFPMGWDAFGLPTENYAVKTGIHPKIITKQNTDKFRAQMKALNLSFDWDREINTSDPSYYKWTQWIFLQMYKKGLAYKKKMPINWCPVCKVGLANEEVVDGKHERCGTIVEQKEKEQWMLAITKYADRLYSDLDKVDYLPEIKLQQRNWIGPSEGAEIEFEVRPTPGPLPKGEGGKFGYQTANPKTWAALQEKALEMRQKPTEAEEKIWQVLRDNSTGCHFRRQHVIGNFIVDFVCLEKSLVIEVDGDIHDIEKERDDERTSYLNEAGFKVLRFKNNEVLKNTEVVFGKIKQTLQALPFGEGRGGAELGGLIKVFTTRPDTIFGVTFLAVPGKEDRFTNQYAVNPATGEEIPIWEAQYVMGDYGSGAVMGVPAHDERDLEFAKKYNLPIVDKPLVDIKEIVKKVDGKWVTRYKLRDWVFSRQRYWGEPIPIIYCDKCGEQPVPEEELPVVLPDVPDFKPRDDGQSPVANVTDWVNTKCPKCGGPARRETDVMPNWAGSSWYYLRYCDPHNDKELASMEKLKYWLTVDPVRSRARAQGASSKDRGAATSNGVDWYNGGMEHVTLHLLYSRFWHKFLFDIGVVPTDEPYARRTAHGLILGENGEKMSKSRGNVVNPDDMITRFGADALRLYEMFMGPFDQAIPWSTDGLVGTKRFLEKAERLKNKMADVENKKLESLVHKTIKQVSEDIEKMKFNTAVSAMMILANEMDRYDQIPHSTYHTLLSILSVFAPGITGAVRDEPWPTWDEEKIKSEKVVIAIQINGKTRDQIEVDAGASEDEVRNMALQRSKLADVVPARVVYVPNRLINIVTQLDPNRRV